MNTAQLMNVSPVFCFGSAGAQVASRVVGGLLETHPWWTTTRPDAAASVVQGALHGDYWNGVKVHRAFQALRVGRLGDVLAQDVALMESTMDGIASGDPKRVPDALTTYVTLRNEGVRAPEGGARLSLDTWLQWNFQFPFLAEERMRPFRGEMASLCVTTNLAGGFMMAQANVSDAKVGVQTRYYAIEQVRSRDPAAGMFDLGESLIVSGGVAMDLLGFQARHHLLPAAYDPTTLAEADDVVGKFLAKRQENNASVYRFARLLELRLYHGSHSGGVFISDARAVSSRLRIAPTAMLDVSPRVGVSGAAA